MKKLGQQAKILQITIGEYSEVQFVPHASSRLAQRNQSFGCDLGASTSEEKKRPLTSHTRALHRKSLQQKRSALSTMSMGRD